jgi:transposase
MRLSASVVSIFSKAEHDRRLLGKPTGRAAYAQPDYRRIHRELRRKGMTLTPLWGEYLAEFADRQTYRYTQFREHYKGFAERLERSMRRIDSFLGKVCRR